MNENFTNMRSLLGALAQALNLVDPNVENHHQQTAYLAYMIAHELGFSPEDIELTIYAALSHDIGFISGDEPKNIDEIRQQEKTVARVGAKLISSFPGSEMIGNIVLYCQRSWSEYRSLPDAEQEDYQRSARIATVIHLADVVSAMIQPDVSILDQVKSIRQAILSQRDTEFSTEAVDAFLRMSELEFIWMDLRYNPSFLMIFTGDIHPVSLDRAVELTGFMSRVIDYRSAFTAMHSAGVAASAEALARLSGMTEDERKMMRIAGYLHDVGKLKVPRRILEKPAKLTEEEFHLMQEHPYNTRLILMNADGFDRIADWAGFHHERLNGKGYPFHFGADELDLGARIMAVADVFSAVTEVRPYRAGMTRREASEVLRENVRAGGICKQVVELLEDNYDEINQIRETASRREGARYYASIRSKA